MVEIDGLRASIAAGEQLAGAIRVARLAVGWTQAQLALSLRVPRPQVARWESGRVRPSPSNQRSILHALRKAAGRQGCGSAQARKSHRSGAD